MSLAQFAEADIGSDVCIASQDDGQIEHTLNLGVEYFPRQAIIRNRLTQHAADKFVSLVQRYDVSAANHLVGKRQARWSRTNHANGLRMSMRPRARQAQRSGDAP